MTQYFITASRKFFRMIEAAALQSKLLMPTSRAIA